MNLDRNPTPDQLRALLSTCDDRSGHHALWVAGDGEVHITRLPRKWPPPNPEETHPEMKLRVETFEIGNGYVGPEAAEAADWVAELFRALTSRWPATKGKTGVEYVDLPETDLADAPPARR
jgi:hypothetical protein